MNKNFIEKYPESASIFYKHSRDNGDYIPDYEYENVAKEIAELVEVKKKEPHKCNGCEEIIYYKSYCDNCQRLWES